MKLSAIYNIWDGVELLEGSLRCIVNHVDVVIIVYQKVSNWGEEFDPYPAIVRAGMNTCKDVGMNIYLHEYKPTIGSGTFNEKQKRNVGLNIARSEGCTHFLHMDCDEYYEDFGNLKNQFINSNTEGSVVPLYTYFKKPTLRFEKPDGYFVPFIHKLKETTQAGVKKYPFYVDPTRRINEDNVIQLNGYMHHFSWVRDDIERKARNSSAKYNIEKGTMLNDYYNSEVAPGFYVKDYEQKLIEVENVFNIVI